MALSPRQRILYTDRANLWEPVVTKDASGRITGKTYSLAASAVPCKWVIRQSTETATPVGRMESDNMFTRDEIHFGDDIAIDADWWIKNVTTNTQAGTDTENTGRYWVVCGQPQSISQRGRRRAQMRVITAIQSQTPPAGVS